MTNYISPCCDMKRWEYCDNSVILANADYYYTKEETEELIQSVSGMTPEQVQSQIDRSIRTKADKSDVEALSETVRVQGIAILDRYTKEETNSLLSSYLSKIEANGLIANYAAIEDEDTLTLNAENITLG